MIASIGIRRTIQISLWLAGGLLLGAAVDRALFVNDLKEQMDELRRTAVRAQSEPRLQSVAGTGEELPGASQLGERWARPFQFHRTDSAHLTGVRSGSQGDVDQAVRSAVTIRAGYSYGAGVLIGHEGYVLTARHVIAETEMIELRFEDSSWTRAEKVDEDSDLDLALLRADVAGREPTAVASVLSVHVGDELLGVGSPYQMAFSVTRGIASFVGRVRDNVRYLQTDIAADPGQSGGPILDAQGRVIGIMLFVLQDSESMSFVLPIDYAFERFDDYLDPSALSVDRRRFETWASDTSE